METGWIGRAGRALGLLLAPLAAQAGADQPWLDPRDGYALHGWLVTAGALLGYLVALAALSYIAERWGALAAGAAVVTVVTVAAFLH